MVSFSSMVAHWSADVIYVKSSLSTHAVHLYRWSTADRCSLYADVQTGLDVTC